MIRIAGVVVLYNPLSDVLENINSYLKQVGILYAVDNSEHPNLVLVEKIECLENVIYKWNGGNVGIAKALNVGATLAIEQQYDFLLMMDQDSVVSANLVEESLEYLSNSSTKEIGILYPYHKYKGFEKPMEATRFKELLVADTSGSLLNLAAYQAIGPFLNELFIDFVDFEYCLRLQVNKFKVIQLNHAILYQSLGDLGSRRLLFRIVAVTNHPPVRVYYRIRNRLFVVRKYFKIFPYWSIKEIITIVNELIKILFFESNKIEKNKMAFRGVRHFFENRYGCHHEEN